MSNSSGVQDAMSNRDVNAITPMHAASVNGDKSSLVKLIAGKRVHFTVLYEKVMFSSLLKDTNLS